MIKEYFHKASLLSFDQDVLTFDNPTLLNFFYDLDRLCTTHCVFFLFLFPILWYSPDRSCILVLHPFFVRCS